MHRMRSTVLAFVGALLLVIQVSGLANQSSQTATTQRYIVGLKPGSRASALAGPDAHLLVDLPGQHAMAVIVSPAGLKRLLRDPRVSYIEEDRLVYQMHHTSPVASGEITWGLDDVHALDAWVTTKGNGIGVCVIDSGIDFDHPEFLRNGRSVVTESMNFNGDGKPTAQDGQGHGTHVAGTIAAALNGVGVAGVAPEVRLYIARIADDNWRGAYTSTVIEALHWCADRAEIFNMSYGSDLSNRAEQMTLQSIYDQGRLLIAASGNSGSHRVGYPAAYPSVIAVGALSADNTLASFSQHGKDQELTAPGVGILSTVPLGSGVYGVASENGVDYDASPLEYTGVGTVSDVPLVECGLSVNELGCAGAPAGDWIALIDRGEITFAEKVSFAMQQGAVAAIIVNNDITNPDEIGTFTLGGDSFWPPVVAVAYNTGQAIRSGGLGIGTVHVGATDYVQAHAAVAAALATKGGGTVPVDPKTMDLAVDAGGPYRANDRVILSAKVTDGQDGSATASVRVTILIRDSRGATVASGSATTGSDGGATFQWKSKMNSPKGTYTVDVSAGKDGYTAVTGSTTFQLE